MGQKEVETFLKRSTGLERWLPAYMPEALSLTPSTAGGEGRIHKGRGGLFF